MLLELDVEPESLDKVMIKCLQEAIYLEMQFDQDDSFIHSALRVLKDYMMHTDYAAYRSAILRDLYGEEI